jgi:hypothetical protein
MKTNDHALLEAALIGYQHQREQIDAKIAELRQELGGKSNERGCQEANCGGSEEALGRVPQAQGEPVRVGSG